METDKRYFLVGLFILATAIAAVAFSVWIAAASKDHTLLYRIHFAESVSGLTVGSQVKFRGVNVGTVDDIRIDPADTRLIQVDVRLAKDTPVKTDTVVTLKPQGITGVVYVEMTGGSPTAPDLVSRTAEGQIPEIPSETSSISAIVNQLPELLGKISRIADRVNGLLSDDNTQSVGHTIHHMETVSAALAENAQRLNALVSKADEVLASLRDVTQGAGENVKELMRNLDASSEQLYETLIDARKTSHNINRLTDSLKDDPSRLFFPPEEKGIPAP